MAAPKTTTARTAKLPGPRPALGASSSPTGTNSALPAGISAPATAATVRDAIAPAAIAVPVARVLELFALVEISEGRQ